MGKSIFEFSDKFNFDSPWENNWGNEDFQFEINRHQHNIGKKYNKTLVA